MRSAGFWTGSWSVTPGSAAHDEEEALMPPREVADCLVQELWQTLRASLEAQARCRIWVGVRHAVYRANCFRT